MYSKLKHIYKMTELKRVGNWYKVSINEVSYNVLIQKEPNSIVCEPSSIIVFDDEFNIIDGTPTFLGGGFSIYQHIEVLMGKVDWKYDMVDEY